MLSLYKLTGKGYENGWFTNFSGRYRVYKGARNTKKSYVVMGYEIITKILTDEERNIAVIRKVNRSNRHSTFAVLKKLIKQMGLERFFDMPRGRTGDMWIQYKPTGQMIMFFGFDQPDKLTSLNVESGFMTDCYVEEAFEIKSEEDFEKLDGTFRGILPDGVFFQITLILNAWDEGHWINDRFFKGRFEDDRDYLLNNTYQDFKDEDYIGNYGIGIYLHTSTYKINEFRDKKNYDRAMEHLREKAPALYDVVGLGMWGSATGKSYPEFNDGLIVSPEYANSLDYLITTIGIDTGLSALGGRKKEGLERYGSAMAMVLQGLTADKSKIVALKEYFHSNAGLAIPKTEIEIADEMANTIILWMRMYHWHPIIMQNQILIYVDSADIGFRDILKMKLKEKNVYNVIIQGSTKFPIHQRVMFSRQMMAFGEHLFSTDVPNLIREHNNSKKGELNEMRENYDNHAITAHEYGWSPFTPQIKRWRDVVKK